MSELSETNMTPINSYISASCVVEAGEIRRLVDMDLRQDSRLVAIVRIEKADQSAKVVLVNNLVEYATQRDLILSQEKTGAKFDLVMYPDFTVKVWLQQLGDGLPFGRIDEVQLNSIIRWADSADEDPTYFPELLSVWKHGNCSSEFGDQVWLHRSREMDALNRLGHSLSHIHSSARFVQYWCSSDEAGRYPTLPDVLIENNFDLDLVDDFFSFELFRAVLT